MFNYSILLIEDNIGDADLVHFYFGQMTEVKVDVTHVETAKEACEALLNNLYDVVLSDLNLPDSSGMKTVDIMVEASRGIPLIVLTGHNDTLLGLQAIKAGAQDYLTKDELAPRLLAKTIQYAIERNKSKMIIESLAIKDELTGLYNRAGLKLLAGNLIELAKRHTKKAGVIFIDLDEFKKINDTFGHNEGDEALIATSSILKETFRNSDILARFGGDEFVAFFLCEEGCKAEIIKKRFIDNLDEYNSNNMKEWSIKASIGIVKFDPEVDVNWDIFVEKADKLMYEEKRNKKMIIVN